MAKLFKNGISLKWFLLLIGIVIGIGYVTASVNPIISNTNSYFDVVWANYFRGDISNVTGQLPNASIPASAANISTNNTFTGRIAQSGSTAITGYLISNSNQLASSTNLNPGTLVYGGDGSSGIYGMDLGYSQSIFVTRFITGDGSRGFSWGFFNANNPTGQSNYTTELMRLNGSGSLLLYSLSAASGSPSALCRNGNEVTVNAAQTCTVSNSSLKNIIGVVGKEEIDKFMQIPIYKFYWKSDTNNTTLHYGSTAQDVEKIFPNLARYNNGNISTYEITELIVLAKAAIVQQQNQIDNLTTVVQNQQFQLDIQSSQIRKICTNQPTLCS